MCLRICDYKKKFLIHHTFTLFYIINLLLKNVLYLKQLQNHADHKIINSSESVICFGRGNSLPTTCMSVCVVHHIIKKYTLYSDIQFSDIYFMKWPTDHVSEQGFQ